MLKNILKLNGAQTLGKSELQSINGSGGSSLGYVNCGLYKCSIGECCASPGCAPIGSASCL